MAGEIEIDGGSGGGQILRTALSLSVITGTPFRLRDIRASRQAPGLNRQHLVAIQAAREISGAVVSGDRTGSMELTFAPQWIRAGEYEFAIGTAGSTGLVLQTVLWPLLFADGPSQVAISGGTHTSMAPPHDFLERALLPRARQMGVQAELRLEQHGFHPAGGGRIRAVLKPGGLERPEWLERGELVSVEARALHSLLHPSVAERELETVVSKLGWEPEAARSCLVHSPGPGNALLLIATFEHGCTVVSAIGARGRPAETVARDAADRMQRDLDVGAPIDEHLADQLLIPMALAGGGRFLTCTPTLHTRTNAAVIERFLPVTFSLHRGTSRVWSIEAQRA